MTTLRLTPARLDLLRAVERGEVIHYLGPRDYWQSRHGDKNVNRDAYELTYHALIALPPYDPRSDEPRLFTLTDAGRAALGPDGGV